MHVGVGGCVGAGVVGGAVDGDVGGDVGGVRDGEVVAGCIVEAVAGYSDEWFYIFVYIILYSISVFLLYKIRVVLSISVLIHCNMISHVN